MSGLRTIAIIASILALVAAVAFLGCLFGSVWATSDELQANLADTAFFILLLLLLPLAAAAGAAGAKAGWWKL